jgi:hypothetical protein
MQGALLIGGVGGDDPLVRELGRRGSARAGGGARRRRVAVAGEKSEKENGARLARAKRPKHVNGVLHARERNESANATAIVMHDSGVARGA